MNSEPQKLSTDGHGHGASGHGLRARHALRERPVRFCGDCESELHPESANGHEVEKEKKTFGRTPGGTVFTVPQTHDMVSQLLFPTQPKNLSDLVVLAILAMLILTLYALPSSMRIPTFAIIFLFWRGCYNVGIGYLLRIQSRDRLLVKWADKSKIFEDPQIGKNPYPQLYKVIKRELETKIPRDYTFKDAPIEYNTWLVFRRVVDLILMCDFVSYCLFAVACGSRPAGEGTLLTIARWLAGWSLVGFNLWVKLDAHRVVKDYAWYWGDFFYLIDQELTFDGVFEMAPHPMYSVGYAGYYGISLLAASYKVLAISIIAHAAQFAFLILVENPHIEKTYNPPPPRKRSGKILEDISAVEPATPVDDVWVMVAAPSVPSPVHNLLGLQNIDLFRITDISVILLQIYVFLLTALTPSTPFYQAFFVLNAIAWRLWYSIGLGFILNRQSNEKAWTRHFVKFGESPDEAWRQWKGMYHLSMTMCHAGFIAASWKMYSFPNDWNYGLVLLKHVVGAMLIALQIWTAFSIYDSLSEFGWFFGDFFFDQAPKLTYSGIYRYLNNPERVLGLAGIWGAVLITRSTVIFCLALLSHILALSFIQFVERPHMEKLYGRNMRREAGLVKSIKRSLPPPLKNWHGNVDKVLGGTVEFVVDFIESARPKLAAGVEVFVKDASALFSQYPARISLTRVAPDLAGYDPKDYSLEIEGTPLPPSAACDYANGKEGAYSRNFVERRSDFKTKVFEYGTPIRVKWTAPLNHSKKDWVGLYKVVDNASRNVTKIASAGRWVATTLGEYDSSSADDGILMSDMRVSNVKEGDGEDKDHLQGEMIFRGDKLWWTLGVFEFRYHHNGKHNVMAISLPFETRIGRFDEDDVELDGNGSLREAVEKALLPVVRNCFDEDPEIAPNTVDEEFGPLAGRNAKYAKRVVFAVQHMFGIEFAPEVVKADGSVKNLAWRICNAKKVLAPYSMSLAKGTTTPTLPKY